MLRRIFLRLGDYVFVTRPLILVPAWSFYLLGSGTAQRDGRWLARPDAFYWGLGCLTAILVTAYLINLVFDQRADRMNDKGHFITRGLFSVRAVVVLAMAFFIAASVAFRHTVPPQRIPLAGALVLALVYSLPPLRLVGRPGFDLAANALGYGGIAFVAGHAAFPGALTPSDAWSAAAPYMFLVGATFLHTTILDVEGDRAADKKTFTVRFGIPASARLAVILAIGGAAWLARVSDAETRDPLSPALLLAGMVTFFIAHVRIRRASARPGPEAARTIGATSAVVVQGMTALIAVAAALVEPWFLAGIAALAVAARLYYRARFGISYPGPVRGDA